MRTRVRVRSSAASLAVLLVLGAACGEGDVPPGTLDTEANQPSIGEQLDPYLEAAIAAHDIPGLTIAVVRDGEVAYEQAFGVESLDTGEPLSSNHLFHFASVSKPFVATAVMQLVEQGKVELDQKVTHYLPYFELADPAYQEITVRQMLDHTSGMPDVEDYEWDKPQTDDGAAERYVRSLSSEEMIGSPGDQCVYSNMAFDTLGDLIAKVSGQPFEDYVKENILAPLGMTESDFLYPRTREELRTRGHIWDRGPAVSEHYPYNRRHAPSSTLNSSAAEMTRWLQANLNRGELDGRRILEDASYDVLWEPSSQMGRSEVGLSWFLREIDGVRTVSHSGGDTGYASYLVLLPDEHAGFVVVSNYDNAPMRMLHDDILGILLGEEVDLPLRPIRADFAKVYLEEGLEKAKAFYREAEQSRANEYEFADRQLNSFGYMLLGEGDIDGAIEVFAFNVELYPEVGNCYDSLGEAYLVRDDEEAAIVNYRRALELNPDNDNARGVLSELGALDESD